MMVERNRSLHRTEWLTTPNTYRKEEVEEQGTSNPRKFTRWVADKEGDTKHPGQATPVRSANQFAPQVSGPSSALTSGGLAFTLPALSPSGREPQGV